MSKYYFSKFVVRILYVIVIFGVSFTTATRKQAASIALISNDMQLLFMAIKKVVIHFGSKNCVKVRKSSINIFITDYYETVIYSI